MVTRAEDNPFPSLLFTESADPATPGANTGRLFLDNTDGLLKWIDDAGTVSEVIGSAAAHIADTTAAHVASSIGFTPNGSIAATDVQAAIQEVRDEASGGSLTDHTHAVTGSGATGGGDTLNPVTFKLPSAMGTTAGQADWDTTNYVQEVYDSQRERAVSSVGWTPAAYPLNLDPSGSHVTAVSAAANGGSMAVAIFVPSHMLLEDVVVRNTDGASARTWGWDLYVNDLNNGNSGENTARRVAACASNESFTASAASFRFITAGSAPVYLAPGFYWLVIQSRHASNAFGIGTVAPVTANPMSTVVRNMTKTTTNPNGATLDLVAATWTKRNDDVGCALRGRVLGMTTVI